MGSNAQENLEKSRAFLEENAQRDDVEQLPSGLQIRKLDMGDGPTPTEADTVTVHYRGTLIDGTEFDSSYSRGTPATFPVNGVIEGWTEALKRMPEGSKWELFLPPELAYGKRGAGADIGPNEALIFEVELLKVG